MKFKKKEGIVYDEKNRMLARVVYYGERMVLERTPACSIGEYFAILSWLMDKKNG